MQKAGIALKKTKETTPAYLSRKKKMTLRR